MISRLKFSDGMPIRIENNQFDASNGVGDDDEFGSSPAISSSPSLGQWGSSSERKQPKEETSAD